MKFFVLSFGISVWGFDPDIIYIIDTTQLTDKYEGGYYAELSDGSCEVLMEDDKFFESKEDKEKTVGKLMEILEYSKEKNHE